MKKILIIGKKSFLGNSLLKLLKKKYKTNIIYYKNLNKFKNTINSYNYIINTSINKNYINKKYNEKFDNDLQISKILEGNKIRYVFFSTRKVYSANANIKENSKLSPKTNYSKNKLITENLLKSKFKKNLLILRISNIIGEKSKYKKSLHKTFIDIFYENAKKGFIYNNKKKYKDFLSIQKFCQIMIYVMLLQALLQEILKIKT